MSEFTLDGRLSSVAKFVRRGARFADVGTDHAYLPVFLLLDGRIERAVCSDINRGPLDNARATAREGGVYERIDFVLTDGAAALSDFGITDMAICGMGGELIAKIIEGAPFIKSSGVRLILQPMTRQEHLRTYLYNNGFSVIAEDYAADSGKFYSIIVAEYTGAETGGKATPSVRYGGICHGALAAERGYLLTKLSAKKRAFSGLKSAGLTDAELLSDIAYIDGLLSEIDRAVCPDTK